MIGSFCLALSTLELERSFGGARHVERKLVGLIVKVGQTAGHPFVEFLIGELAAVEITYGLVLFHLLLCDRDLLLGGLNLVLCTGDLRVDLRHIDRGELAAGGSSLVQFGGAGR